MKKLLLITCLLFSVAGYAQRPTGGCGYSVKIIHFGPPPDTFILYNGTYYTVGIEISPTQWEKDAGTMIVSIDTTVVGSTTNDVFNEEISVNLKKIYADTGRHSIRINYYDRASCTASWYGSIIIKDSTKTTMGEDTLVVSPPTWPADTLHDIAIYPMPVWGNYIYINGLIPAEVNYSLLITDMLGRKIEVSDVSKNSSSLTIPAHHIPDGLYIVSLKTAQRNVRMKVQVCR